MTAIRIGNRYLLNRTSRTTDGGWAPVEVIGHQGDWLVRVRDGISGQEYPCDPASLKTAREATSSLIPRRTGKETAFRAHGRTFRVKRHAYQNYSLFQDGLTTRSRWGTRDEMLADLAHVLEYGTLPEPAPYHGF